MIKRRPNLSNFWMWPVVMLVCIALFLLIPGSFAEKANWILHGLCAQNHDHTHEFGGVLLPLDARCTGIYAGALLTLIILGVRGRILAMELPERKFLVVLVGFGVLMAVDGLNSLFTDLGWWHLWESSNVSRVITGYAMGISLAVALAWLVGGTVFQIASREPAVQSWRELGTFLIPLPILLLMLETQWGWLHAPISLFLMMSAWIVLTILATVTILLATRNDERIISIGQLHMPGAVGLVAGLVVMVLLSLGRSWLERVLGIPSTL